MSKQEEDNKQTKSLRKSKETQLDTDTQTHSHTQKSHKTTKPESIIYMQGPVRKTNKQTKKLQSIIRQRTSKAATRLFSCWPSTTSHGAWH